MAFQFCEILVINLSIGWESFINLLYTFYSSNDNKVAQSAGNKLNGSSETIRENTFYLFLYNYNKLFGTTPKSGERWLNWFIGFVEGDGAILVHNNACRLVITQKETKILEEIKTTLNMGTVKYYYDINGNIKYGRFIVTGIMNIFLLYSLFNGNLLLSHRISQLEKWYIVLKNSQKISLSSLHVPELNLKKKNISLDNSWLSGFTDAEGCFVVNIYKQSGKDYVRLVFRLDQKNEKELLNSVSLLFADKELSRLRPTKNGNMYKVEISCNDIKKDTYKKSQIILIFLN